MATNKLFRCMNPRCQEKDLAMGRFWSVEPVCPQCGIEAKDQKFGHLIVRLSVVHLDPPTDIPGIGWNVRACDETKIIQVSEGASGIPNPYHIGSGNVNAVNCPECKNTSAYKAALAVESNEDGPSHREAMFDRARGVGRIRVNNPPTKVSV